MNSIMWSTDEYIGVTSYLTGRTMLASTGDKFVIPPTFSHRRLTQTLQEYREHLAVIYASNRPRLSPCLQERLTALESVTTIAQFGHAFNLLLQSPSTKSGVENRPRMADLCVRLWQNDCLIWPAVHPVTLGLRVIPAWGFNDDVRKFIASMAGVQKPGCNAGRMRVRAIITLLLARSKARESGDLTPEVASEFFVSHMIPRNLRLSTVSDLIHLQTSTHGAKVKHIAPHYFRVGRFATRSDDNFAWALESDPSLTEWISVAKEYMNSLERNRIQRRIGINTLFDYLVKNTNVTRQPTEYLKASYQAKPALDASEWKTANSLFYFFERILELHCVMVDDMGNKLRLAGYRNPLELRPHPKRAAETHRNPMPTRLVRMLHEILIENDFAWARNYGVSRWNRKGGDMHNWVNPKTKEVEEIWSPVRAIAILIKVLLPCRTFQVRMLDSGEADTEVYRPKNGGWLPNVRKETQKKKAIQNGVFYRHRDPSGKESVFLHFNTNKTGDVDAAPDQTGYIMPWEHQEAIGHLTDLRDWQERYNPLIAPAKWSDIRDLGVSSRYSPDYLRQRGTACFLFRDPCSPYSEHPVTDSRLATFWRNLNAELERRLVEAGETMPDGSPIKLVERLENNGVGAAIFDLHSLRVTMITAMAEGGVPIDVLMKVVGHASVIMTLYYTKFSPSHISERLNDGELRIHSEEQRNWQKWLTRQSREILVAATAHTAPYAVDALTEVSPNAWVVRDHGICPVGCSRCQDGGPAVVQTDAYQKFGPVPGGASNCVSCRFFITGPAFLLGLQAYFDNIGYCLQNASVKYQAAKDHFETLEAEYHFAREQHTPVPWRQVQQLDIAAGNLDQQTSIVDGLALSWHAAYRLIEQSLAILQNQKSRNDGEAYALVAVGGLKNLEIVIEESTDFELVDRVCQSAVFFEGLDAKLPNLKRMRAFDAMLKRSGHSPAFVDMTEEDALSAGNQLAAFIYTRFGRSKANSLMSGQKTLKILGIERQVMRKIHSIANIQGGRRSARLAIADTIRKPD